MFDMGLQISLGLQQQLICLVVPLLLGLHPSPLGSFVLLHLGLCPYPLAPSSFSTWGFVLFHFGLVKLADFGVATKLTEADVNTHSVVGTPYWMAPEVLTV